MSEFDYETVCKLSVDRFGSPLRLIKKSCKRVQSFIVEISAELASKLNTIEFFGT